MVSRQRLSEARIILEFAPDLATQILTTSATPFSQAFEEAKRRKADAESNAEKMARLLKEAPARGKTKARVQPGS
jgi:hypothetical protein